MKLNREVLAEMKVKPGESAGLDARSTKHVASDWLGSQDKDRHGEKRKKVAEEDLGEFVDELAAAQELLWANGTYSLLIVLQAMDAAGKDGTIKHVMSGVNPQGCRVEAFKQPSAEELGHDFLWRCSKALPELGAISIFNRSYYEDVLVTRVHPELLAKTHEMPSDGPDEKFWKDRYSDINAFEHHLHRSKTRIVKVFLHVSKEEQKNRFLSRLEVPAKNWKFSVADLAERQPGRVRGSAERHLDRVGAVVRGAGRPQVRSEGTGRRHHRRRDRSDGPEVPQSGRGRSGGAR